MKKKTEQKRNPDVILPAIMIFITIVSVIVILAGCSNKQEPAPEYHWSTIELLKEHQKQEIDDWKMLQLAIALTESHFNAEAIGSAEDRGIYQLRPVYIREVNRLYGTDYKPEDAFSIEKSVEMFEMMQEAKNPEKDLDKAIYYHNKNAGYRRKVLDNLEIIRRYEVLREELMK